MFCRSAKLLAGDVTHFRGEQVGGSVQSGYMRTERRAAVVEVDDARHVRSRDRQRRRVRVACQCATVKVGVGHRREAHDTVDSGGGRHTVAQLAHLEGQVRHRRDVAFAGASGAHAARPRLRHSVRPVALS